MICRNQSSFLLLVSFTAALFATGCDGATRESPGPPASLQTVSGNDQSGIVADPLSDPLLVKVIDANDAPVSGHAVNFVVTSGGGSVFGGNTTTDADGLAQELWTLGTSTADSQRVEARLVSTGTDEPLVAVFRATALASSPTTMTKAGGDEQSAEVGRRLADALVVKVVDEHGNGVPGAAVAWAVSTGSGSISPTSGETTATGEAEASWTPGTTTGRQTATASVAGVGTVTFTITAMAGPPATVTAEVGDGQSTTVGSRLADSLVVVVQDAFGNPARTTAVWEVTSGGGTTIPGPLDTDPGGRVRAAWRLGDELGEQTATASVGDLTASFSATAIPGPWVSALVGTGSAGFSCGAVNTGGVYCWGRIIRTSDIFAALTPQLRSGGLAFASISIGEGDVCGITPGGAGYCWDQFNSEPLPVADGLILSSISAGGRHHCAIATDGSAYCWGDNGDGELGNGTRVSSDTASPVSGGLSFTSVSASPNTGPAIFSETQGHSCGVTTTGEAYCWGHNTFGQLGNGTTTSSSVPVPVAGGLAFASISTGTWHTCGVTTDGRGFCWGTVAIGSGTTAESSSLNPALVDGGHTFTVISAGHVHSCGVTDQGTAYCWGRNGWGKLGDGSATDSPTPVLVLGEHPWSQISAGGYQSCGVTVSGAAYCWGRGGDFVPLDGGSLGDGTSDGSLVPVRVIDP